MSHLLSNLLLLTGRHLLQLGLQHVAENLAGHDKGLGFIGEGLEVRYDLRSELATFGIRHRRAASSLPQHVEIVHRPYKIGLEKQDLRKRIHRERVRFSEDDFGADGFLSGLVSFVKFKKRQLAHRHHLKRILRLGKLTTDGLELTYLLCRSLRVSLKITSGLIDDRFNLLLRKWSAGKELTGGKDGRKVFFCLGRRGRRREEQDQKTQTN